MIRLYRDNATSTVAEEYASLHSALADMLAPPSDGQLIDNGVLLAYEHRHFWTITPSGARALVREHEHAKADHPQGVYVGGR